jgi:hypothetical protein
MESIKEFPRGISDQVISGANSTRGLSRVHPGPGLKLRHGGLTPEASGNKLQAPSIKLSNQPGRASSGKLLSHKHRGQASSHKQQAQ